MAALTAQQRRSLRMTLRGLRCPRCRHRELAYESSHLACVCRYCGHQCQPADLGLAWKSGDDRRPSYWLRRS